MLRCWRCGTDKACNCPPPPPEPPPQWPELEDDVADVVGAVFIGALCVGWLVAAVVFGLYWLFKE